MTRLTQPFRRGARAPGVALDAAKRGASVSGWRPPAVLQGKKAAASTGGVWRAPRVPRRRRPAARVPR